MSLGAVPRRLPCDWRIPNRKELESLIDLETSSPAVDLAFDSACTPGCDVTTCSCLKQTSMYWTSTTYQQLPAAAWLDNFVVGNVFADINRATITCVRCVGDCDEEGC